MYHKKKKKKLAWSSICLHLHVEHWEKISELVILAKVKQSGFFKAATIMFLVFKGRIIIFFLKP